MNDAYLLAVISESVEADPLFARRPNFYGVTNRALRSHLSDLPRRGVSLPKLSIPGILSFTSRASTAQTSICCAATSTN